MLLNNTTQQDTLGRFLRGFHRGIGERRKFRVVGGRGGRGDAGSPQHVARAVPPLNPDEPVRIPSERAYRERERRQKEGIPVDRAVYDQLRALAWKK